ncbi:beta-carotene isomerase D27, chloroplastic isoform X2 [Macadamia integrifolia]|uniref:beta-carotene isomerase D27, chloroplastic isoform X2 n=1 Tax=Macadamia integrifolia TaxID=60698 RepID=UPI001C4EE273|nr:beta-carotene isomerase D27, chloroplastic isoform X2 [Macadamia integrifolia]
MVVLINLQGVGVGCPHPPPTPVPTMLAGYPHGHHTSGRWRRRRNGDFVLRCAIAEPSGEPAPLGQKTQYRDGLLEKAFMALFARKMKKYAASPNTSTALSAWNFDYDTFVDVSRRVMQGRSRLQQQEVVREVLLSMLPPGAPAQFRKLFPPTKWAAEFNAALTVPFFHWLVGPSEVVEVEVNGVKQRSGVHIKKCRINSHFHQLLHATDIDLSNWHGYLSLKNLPMIPLTQ